MPGLIAGSSRIVGREDLALIPTPEATATHHPVPHTEVVQTLIETLGRRRVNVVKDEYAISPSRVRKVVEDGEERTVIEPEGLRLFGFLEVDIEHKGVRLGIALRNSHDKSFSLGMVAGYRVMVCTNLAFYGEFDILARKHTKRLSLVDSIVLGVDRAQRHFGDVTEQIDVWSQFELSTERAKSLIYDAYVLGGVDAPKHLARATHDAYFNPPHEEFAPRTMWSLSNSFTEAFKALEPVRQMEATASLAPFLATYH